MSEEKEGGSPIETPPRSTRPHPAKQLPKSSDKFQKFSKLDLTTTGQFVEMVVDVAMQEDISAMRNLCKEEMGGLPRSLRKVLESDADVQRSQHARRVKCVVIDASGLCQILRTTQPRVVECDGVPGGCEGVADRAGFGDESGSGVL